ncbi:hypothetical protein AMTR_s00022p00082630 [Amborella trichopoda]|uniref:Uncharacterized protein n=1 Tax=Amborella trichopoda TaxID=13333 RepID=W1PVY9_AMBTC|nr:hypothetical protein AMTR_s00022p00082630 [Amborella trichopoda]
MLVTQGFHIGHSLGPLEIGATATVANSMKHDRRGLGCSHALAKGHERPKGRIKFTLVGIQNHDSITLLVHLNKGETPLNYYTMLLSELRCYRILDEQVLPSHLISLTPHVFQSSRLQVSTHTD